MKRISVFLIAFLVYHSGFCQKYASIALNSYFPKFGFSPGTELNLGYILKDKESRKRNYMIGVGANFELLSAKIPYLPIYAQAGYFNSLDKITPYVLARLGYGIYNGTGAPIRENVDKLKGGVFMDLRTGIGLQINKSKSFAPFIGLSYIMFQPKESKNENDYYKAFINAGVALIIFH
jgi:hypothetical protein